MTKARKDIVKLEATPFYHIVSRCVRQSYLCGIDNETGTDYSHRKKWIVDKIKFLSSIFAIKIAAYAVMSNHYHLVLCVDKKGALAWTKRELIERCRALFPNKVESLERLAEANPTDPRIERTLEEWRHRLYDISWYMSNLNSSIARAANKEDNKKGHFWESRFKSQALLNLGSVLSAMVYVDLNPIRAKLSDSLEDSDFTSIQERIKQFKASKASVHETNIQPKGLMAFHKIKNHDDYLIDIDFELKDYILLVEKTGKLHSKDKRGQLPRELASIVDRLGIERKYWKDMTSGIETNFLHLIGPEQAVHDFEPKIKAPKGIRFIRKIYRSAA